MSTAQDCKVIIVQSDDEEVKQNWVVFSDDWGRHPSSCQYLMRQLRDRVHLTWVNTIGMRTPRLDRATLERVFGKVRHAFTKRTLAQNASAQTSSNLQFTKEKPFDPTVLSPMMWPWFTRPHDRWLNRRLLTNKLASVIRKYPQPRVVVTTIPIVADLIDRLPADLWVYYCVDDFSVWPGLDQSTMLRMERDLIERADCFVSVSEVLQRKLDSYGKQSLLLTHGVDSELWKSKDCSFVWPSGVQQPVVLFWGVIDKRLDSEFVKALAAKLQSGSIVFVGPHQDPDPQLARLSNVHLLPGVPVTELPKMASAAACLIMPYSDSEVTRAMQPLKLKEYLATGLPVVARELPSTLPWYDACDLASTSEDFAQLVCERMKTGVLESQVVARQRLAHEGWDAKATDFWNFVRSQLVAKRGA
jgi:glycosyltransferase involved in cell wall biosynthesis